MGAFLRFFSVRILVVLFRERENISLLRAARTILPFLTFLLMAGLPVYSAAPTVSFNPSGGSVNFSLSADLTISFNQAIRKLDDTPMENDDLDSYITFKLTNDVGVDVPYSATIDITKTIITINPTADLTEGQVYFVEMAPVENITDEATSVTSTTFTIDNTAPTLAISAPSSTETNFGPITYTITYTDADNVTLSNGDITLNKTSTADGSINVTGGGTTTRTVTISSITGNGTLGISIAAGSADDDAGNLALAAGPSTTFSVDTDPPTAIISSPSVSDTQNGPVTYTVTYSNADLITLVNGDVNLNTTGDANGSVNVTGSGMVSRTITISSITGDGTIGISLDANTASDNAGNNAAAVGPSGIFNVDNSPPTAIISAPSVSATQGGPVTYTVTYTDADLITLANGDVNLNTTGNANGSVNVSGSGTVTRTITISSITGDGTIGISLDANTANDDAGNSSAAIGPSGTFIVDNDPPEFTDGVIQDGNKNQITANFDDNIQITNSTGFSVSGTTAGPITGVSGSGGSTLVFTLSGNVKSGDVVNLAYDGSGNATDAVGNSLTTFGPSLIENNVAPLITSATIYNANPDEIEVVFDDIITISNDNGFSVTGIPNGQITSVMGSGTNTLKFAVDENARVTDTNIQLNYDGSGSPKNSENIDLANVSGYNVSNLVLAIPEPSNHVASFDATENNKISIDLDWIEVIAPTQAAENYLIVGKDLTVGGSYAPVNDGTPVADDADWNDGNFAINVPVGTITERVNNLNSGHNYQFAIYPYTNVSSSINYKTAGVPEDNHTLSLGVKATVKSGTAPNDISSLIDTESEADAIDYNFRFAVQDDGNNAGSEDNAPTLIDQIIITRKSNDGTTDWTKVIAGAILEDQGSGSMSSASTADITINADNIIITNIPNASPTDLGYVANNSTKTYDLKVWLRNDMTTNGLSVVIDRKDIVFEILHTDITVAPLSTTFASSSTNSGNDNNRVDVDADRLYWKDVSIPVNATAHTNFSVTVEAIDENFNVDINIDNEVVHMEEDPDIGDSGDINRLETSGSENVTDGTLNNGTFTKSNLQVHQAGSYMFRAMMKNPPPNLTDAVTGPHLFNVADDESDIVSSAFDPTDNIAHFNYQSNDITAAGVQSIKIGEFTLRDGGAGNDSDGTETALSSLTLSITNPSNLNQIAIFDGTNIIESKSASSSVSFTNISTIIAADDGTATFSIYASFNPIVVDNQNFQLSITAATAAGSTFAAPNAGGASTPLVGDDNRISVVSTELRFISNTSPVLLNAVMAPALTIEATDVLGSRDLDRDSEIVSLTSTGTLTGTTLTTTLSNGFGTFPDVIHTNKGNTLALTATLASHNNAVSNSFDVTVSNETTITLQDPGIFTSPSNILYKDYQSTDITGTGVNDIKIGEFIIKEGGADLTDGDGVSTFLTSIDIDITNHENIRRIALYDESGLVELGEVSGAATASFTGFSYEIPEGNSRTLQLFVSYNSLVDDNEQSVFTISSVATSSQSSDISSFNVSTSNSGDINRIEVVASKLGFTTNPDPVAYYASNLTTTPVLLATDIFNNTDVDYSGPITVTNAAGLGMTNDLNGNFIYNNGVITFNANFNYTGGGTDADGSDGTLTVSDGLITDAVSTPVVVNYSGTSDIIEVSSFSHTDNIDYTNYQENVDIIDDGNSIVMERFKLRDGGGTAPDDDGSATVLNSITLQIANWENIRRIELFDAGANNALPTTGINEQIVTNDLVTFTGLALTAPDNGSVDFTVRVSFHGDDYPAPTSDASRDLSPIGDNEAITFKVTSTMEDAFSSQLEFINAGGATSTLTGDENRIEVTADRAIFTSDVNSSPSTYSPITTPNYWVIKAKDEYYSNDVDFTGNIGNITTSAFTPTANLTFQLNDAPITNLPGSFTAGVYDFQTEIPTLQYTLDGLNGFVHVAVAGITDATSRQHSVFASEESVLEYVVASTQVFIPYKDHIDAQDPTRYSLGEFIIRDGGVDGTDVDGGSTVLSDLSISITNPLNLADIALYDNTGTMIPGTEIDNPTGSINWSGLSITAPDDDVMMFSIRSFFKTTVTDNHPLDIEIIAVAEAGGSKFAFDQGGIVDGTGATTPTGDNIINVIATQLDFDAVLLDPEQGIDIPITPTQPRVYAHDEVGNLDLDFSETVIITTPGAGIGNLPLNFSNTSSGILDFPDFEYTSTGDGTITVTANNGLTKTSNTVDVIHTTFSNLDNGSGATNLNNGIEALSVILAGGKNKAVLGFSASSITSTPGEPILQDIFVRFGNPITNSLENIRLVTSPSPVYSSVTATVKKIGIKNLDFVKFEAINTTLPIDGSEIYYFVVADIITTANFTTPSIEPVLIATGTPDPFIPNEDVTLSTGSVDANITGRSYVFNDANPPLVTSLTPNNGNENFPQGNLISIQFNEAMVPKDSLIYVNKSLDNSAVATLKIIPGATSVDNTTFFFDPTAPVVGNALEGDTQYYITIPAGVKNISGFLDKSGNAFTGFSSPNEWLFVTSDNVAPFFTEDLAIPTLPAEAVNILDVGFDLRISLDEAGKLFYIVVDPDVTTGTPTVAEIRGGSFPGTIVSGSADILRGFEYHYISIFDDNNFPTPASGGENFRVWVTAEDLALPAPNAMVDADPLHPGKKAIDGTFIPNPGGGVIIQPIDPLNAAVDICLGDFQYIFAPINIVEGAPGDFETGNDLTMNFILPPEFSFKTDNVNVSGQGDDISDVKFSFINNTILTISYDISPGANGRDKLIISGMEVKALGTPGVTNGDIIRLGGTGANAAIPDGTLLVRLNTVQTAPVEFITDPNTSAIGDANEKVALLTPSLSPLDKGTKVFTGPGVFGDTLFIAAAGLGTHTISLNYTSDLGCTSTFSLNRTIFDSDEAIAGLDQVYATDYENDTILFDARLPNFLLIGLGVEVAPDQQPGNFASLQDTLDVAASLDTLNNGNYIFKPGVFKTQVNFDKFFNTIAKTNEGGLIGSILFTGVYENQFDTNLRDTLEQTVDIWLSPTGEVSMGVGGSLYGPIGDNTFDLDNTPPTINYDANLEFCEYEDDLELEGSSSNGYFSVSVPHLGILNSTTIAGLTDNQDGTGSLNLQEMVDDTSLGFQFGEIEVSFTVLQLASGDSNTVAQTIRVNPTPIANFTVPSVLCVDTPINFIDATTLDPADQAKVDSPNNNATFHTMTDWTWNFNDVANSTGDNPNIVTGEDTVVHTFKDPNIYNITLNASDDFGCAVVTNIDIVIGGLPSAEFQFAGTSIGETMTFQSQSTVFSSPQLVHSIDSVAWDIDGNGVYDIGSNDNISGVDNNELYSFNASNLDSAGTYEVKFAAISTVGCTDTLIRTIEVLRNEVTSNDENDVYSETFTTDNAGWVAFPEVNDDWSFSPSNSWELGNPSNGIITPYEDPLDPSINGASWVTGLASSYAGGERSYVYSPTFDLSQLERPMLQFDIFRNLEAQDGVLFEYSTDSLNILDPNKVWTSLGEGINEGIEWFNAIGLASSPGNDNTGIGWTGTAEDTTWVKAKHDLTTIYDNISDQAERDQLMSRVNFRMGLGAISGIKNTDGFAFDNVRIGNRTRTVLLENFTSMAGSNVNKTQNDAINSLASGLNETEVVVVTYQTSFDGPDVINMSNPSDPGARALYYGISENPRVAIDGVTTPDADISDDNLLFTDWGEAYYRKQSLQISPFSIDLTLTGNDGKLDINAVLTARTNEIQSDFVVHVAVVAKEILATELQVNPASEETSFYSTVIKMVPNAAGTKFDVNGDLFENDTRNLNVTWDPYEFLDPGQTNVTEDRLRVVVFVQDEQSRTVFQADYIDMTDALNLVLGVEDKLNSNSATLYPNPVNHELTVQLAKPLSTEQTAIIFDNTGKKVAELRFNAGQDKLELTTTEYLPGIYMITIPTNEGAVVKRFIVSHK